MTLENSHRSHLLDSVFDQQRSCVICVRVRTSPRNTHHYTYGGHGKTSFNTYILSILINPLFPFTISIHSTGGVCMRSFASIHTDF